MSTFRVPVVRIKGFGKHPNAETLSITQVEGSNCIFRTGDFKEGDLAVYIPRDAIVPEWVAGTGFLHKDRRVRAIRLRGIYSEGVLLPFSVLLTSQRPGDLPVVRVVAHEGDDCSRALGITKYEEPIPVHMRGEMEHPLSYAPVYDIESGRKHSAIIAPGENVVVTEKLHGTNFRACYDPDRGFMVGSHNNWWRHSPGNLYWEAAKQYDLANKLRECPGVVVYGEVYGQVQDMKYDSKPGQRWLALFDIYGSGRAWLAHHNFRWLANDLGLPVVPTLYEGPFDLALIEKLSDGKSALASHFREGVVVKPQVERTDPTIGRVILKWVGQTYKLRKNGTEAH